ncbi:MAG: cell division septal protein FtsQ [Candidatus Azotimanducaceae bacterium]|jgi:cell division septal protein FtsQ
MTKPSAGFFWATTFFVGLVLFATLSVDQKSVGEIVVVGDLSEAQLGSIKLETDALKLTREKTPEVKVILNNLSWVHHVNIRKNWPDGLVIEVTPERAIAYWNDDAFITQEGNVVVTDLIVGGDLPHLYGPVGREFDVMTQYQQLWPTLRSSGHEIKVLSMNDRSSWSIETQEDITVFLGKDDLRARMTRFLVVSESLRKEGDKRRIKTMDARYANGVAVDFYNNEQLEIADISKREGEHKL